MIFLAQLSGELGTVLQVVILSAVVGQWIHLSSRVTRLETKVEDLPCKQVPIKQHSTCMTP